MREFEAQKYLKHGKGEDGINEPKQRRLKPKRRSRKNWTIRFGIPDYPVFPEQIESE
jgi:hypothetical protein